jgi:dihydrofolate synthase/folylpolyglutamate synthase
VVIGDTHCPKSVLEHARAINAIVSLREHEFWVQQQNLSTDEVCHSQWSWRFDDKQVNRLNKPFIPQDNVATALTVLALLDDFMFAFDTQSINSLIEKTKVPGRTELLKIEGLNSPVLLDVGHNPQAARYLVEHLKSQKYNKLYAVSGMLKDKDIANTFKPLLALVDHWYLGDLSMPRGATAEELAKKLSLNEDSFNCFDNITQAFKMANKNSTTTDLILVFGSFHTVAEVRRLLL